MALLWVRHTPASAAIARRSVSEAMKRAGLSDADAFDAALMASELVGNAVRHAPPLPSGHLLVRWTVDGERYEVAVTDGGRVRELKVQNARSVDTCGRGLRIISAISADWGVRFDDDATTVWAQGTVSRPLATSGVGRD